jgi:hypothetical protein
MTPATLQLSTQELLSVISTRLSASTKAANPRCLICFAALIRWHGINAAMPTFSPTPARFHHHVDSALYSLLTCC